MERTGYSQTNYLPLTYNVYQLLHLRDSVEDLELLWSHSCFFFEDLNGDFRDLFHGT